LAILHSIQLILIKKMSILQKKIILLLTSVLGIVILGFKYSWFLYNQITIYTYMLCVPVALTSFVIFVARLTKINTFFSLIILATIEIVLYVALPKVVAEQKEPFTVKNNSMLFKIFHLINAQHQNITQFDKNIGQYDSILFYKLRPNVHVKHSSKEFSTNFLTNSAGYRSEEQSLVNPEIVFIGDSYTMGWGVENEDCFANKTANYLQYKGLNMGVSSYNTVREILALQRISLASCRFLVVQYCSNDAAENIAYIENKFQYQAPTLAKYEETVLVNLENKTYYPYKYTFNLLKSIFKKVKNKDNVDKKIDSPQETEAFFSIVAEIRKFYQGEIIVLHANKKIHTTKEKYKNFSNYLSKNPHTKLSMVDISSILTEEHFFRFDRHWNKEGHTQAAKLLYKHIKKVENNFYSFEK
jgi:hypothetical protein